MEAKHTPGPWTADGTSVDGPDGECVCSVTHYPKPTPRQSANARLIAAAPTTASMAMDFTMLVESFLRPEVAPRNVTESELAEAMYALRAHIAKATGAA